MSTVTVRGIVKTFPARVPVPALRGIDLDVAAGGLTAVLGPSGCGKSTLLRIIAGFERPDAGTVTLGDRTVTGPGIHVAPEQRAVGIVPQEGALFPHLDVAGNIGFGLRRQSRDQRRARVAQLLELVGLPGYQQRRPQQLSGGQQQRVALARALAPAPDVVLLDEPFAALDAGLRAAVREQVADLLAATATTAILVTHDQAEAFAIADIVAVMRAGRIVQAGRPQAVYRHPADLEAAAFLGEVITLPGTLHGTRVECELGSLPVTTDPTAALPDAGRVTVMVRPEQITRDATSPRQARVTAVRFQGHDTVVHVDLDGQPFTARWHGAMDVARDDMVGIGVAGPVTVYPSQPAEQHAPTDALT